MQYKISTTYHLPNTRTNQILQFMYPESIKLYNKTHPNQQPPISSHERLCQSPESCPIINCGCGLQATPPVFQDDEKLSMITEETEYLSILMLVINASLEDAAEVGATVTYRNILKHAKQYLRDLELLDTKIDL